MNTVVEKILKIDKTGTITSIGTGAIGSNDGPSESATFDTPNDLAIDAQDNIYVADYGSNLIRKIDPWDMFQPLPPVQRSKAPMVLWWMKQEIFLLQTEVVTRFRKIDTRGNVYVADRFNDKI